MWLDASDVRRGALRCLTLAGMTLFAACGGGNRENAGETEGAAVTDSAVPAPADHTAPAVDSATSAAPDSAATPSPATVPDSTPTQSAQRPSKPSAPAKPAKPAAKPADTTTSASASTPNKPAAPSQPSAAAPSAPSAPSSGETQTASEPLRDAYHQAPKDTVDQATYDGWKQYNLNCARCHGEDVMGTTIAPHLVVSLKPDGPVNTPELFTQIVCAGRPAKGMPAWCSLGMEPAKINQIYSYVKGRSAGKIGPGRPAVKQQG